MRRRTGIMVVTALFSVLLAVPAGAVSVGERSLGLSATTFDFSAAPGATGKGELFVINEGDSPVSVKVYAANQQIKEDGTAEYITPPVDVNPVTSPASWVRIILPPNAKTLGNIPYIEMKAGESIPVAFEVDIPKSAAPGDRQAVLFFEMFAPDEVEAGTARVNARIGARIKTRVTGAVDEKLEVRPFRVPRLVMGDKDAYSFTVRNSGNVDALIDVNLLVLDSSKDEVATSEVMTRTPVYAGALREYTGTLDLSDATIGPYTVRLVVSYPSAAPDAQGLIKTIEEESVVWVVPVWLVVAGLALLGGGAMYATWASGRRAAEKRLRASRAERRRGATRGRRRPDPRDDDRYDRRDDDRYDTYDRDDERPRRRRDPDEFMDEESTY